MPVTTIPDFEILRVPKFVASDGRVFVPAIVNGHYGSVDTAISAAKQKAEQYEKGLAERRACEEMVRRLFGDKADAVLDALWSPRMSTFQRRVDVLKELDKIVNGAA